METLLYIIHAAICVALILLILIQQGKGAGVGFSMGGASQAMFGGSGGREFFIKLTAGLAIAFMVICIGLAKMAVSGAGQYHGVLAGAESPAAPGVPGSAAAPGAPAGAAPAAAFPIKPAQAVPAKPAPAAPAPVAPSKP